MLYELDNDHNPPHFHICHCGSPDCQRKQPVSGLPHLDCRLPLQQSRLMLSIGFLMFNHHQKQQRSADSDFKTKTSLEVLNIGFDRVLGVQLFSPYMQILNLLNCKI